MFEHILVPLDDSSLAECVLPVAVSLARTYGARLVLAHILRRPEIPDPLWASEEELGLLEQLAGCQQRRAERYLQDVSKRLPVDAEVELQVSADVPGALQALSEGHAFDLTLISAHGYSASARRSYGSVATSLIGYGSTPLLIMQDFVGEQLVPSQDEVVTAERHGH